MSGKRKQTRYLKKLMLVCIIMDIVITIATLAICYKDGEIGSGVVAALLGAWSIELILGALMKINETKLDTTKTKTNGEDESV